MDEVGMILRGSKGTDCMQNMTFEELIDGLELKSFLAPGSMANVYHATMFGNRIVCKVLFIVSGVYLAPPFVVAYLRGDPAQLNGIHSDLITSSHLFCPYMLFHRITSPEHQAHNR
jgi:hypothetical protein